MDFPIEFKMIGNDLWSYTQAYIGAATTDLTWKTEVPVQVLQITGNTLVYPDKYNYVIGAVKHDDSAETFLLYINHFLDVAEPVRKKICFHEKFSGLILPSGTEIALRSGSTGAQDSIVFTWLFKQINVNEQSQEFIRKCDIISWLKGECIHGDF